jgi:CRP-like cAMP-binding protein
MQGNYIDEQGEVDLQDSPATIVTTQPCTLLSISRRDLLRFGPAMQEAMQSLAWARHELISGLSQRASTATAWLEATLMATRSLGPAGAPP